MALISPVTGEKIGCVQHDCAECETRLAPKKRGRPRKTGADRKLRLLGLIRKHQGDGESVADATIRAFEALETPEVAMSGEPETRFWMVFNATTGGPPVQRHAANVKAVREASRMARLHPGNTFVVLESRWGCRTTNGEALVTPVHFHRAPAP